MKEHMDNGGNIEALVGLLSNNLNSINDFVVDYRTETENKVADAEKHISSLKEQLVNMEKLNKKLEESLSSQFHIARHDVLTALPNRIYYNEYVEQAYARYKRAGHPLSLGVVDIDYFKKVNDTYGHLAGDEVLKITASLLQKSIREVDFCARYGGEEFVIVFEDCSIDNAANRLEQIRQTIESYEYTTSTKTLNVTASFGVAELKPNELIQECFLRADKALYTAKEKGRNQVIKA